MRRLYVSVTYYILLIDLGVNIPNAYKVVRLVSSKQIISIGFVEVLISANVRAHVLYLKSKNDSDWWIMEVSSTAL